MHLYGVRTPPVVEESVRSVTWHSCMTHEQMCQTFFAASCACAIVRAEYLMGRPSSMVTIRLVTAEWASEANDRELEKIALQHIKEQDKAAAREARVQVTLAAPCRTPNRAAPHLHCLGRL